MSKERLEPTGQSILNIVGGQNTALTKPKIGDFKGNKNFENRQRINVLQFSNCLKISQNSKKIRESLFTFFAK